VTTDRRLEESLSREAVDRQLAPLAEEWRATGDPIVMWQAIGMLYARDHTARVRSEVVPEWPEWVTTYLAVCSHRLLRLSVGIDPEDDRTQGGGMRQGADRNAIPDTERLHPGDAMTRIAAALGFAVGRGISAFSLRRTRIRDRNAAALYDALRRRADTREHALVIMQRYFPDIADPRALRRAIARGRVVPPTEK